jgi:hypothetical protein
MSRKGSPPPRPYSFFGSVATYVAIGIALAIALHFIAGASPQVARWVSGGVESPRAH